MDEKHTRSLSLMSLKTRAYFIGCAFLYKHQRSFVRKEQAEEAMRKETHQNLLVIPARYRSSLREWGLWKSGVYNRETENSDNV